MPKPSVPNQPHYRRLLEIAVREANSQVAVARAIGVTGAFISVIRRGQRPVSKKVADWLDANKGSTDAL